MLANISKRCLRTALANPNAPVGECLLDSGQRSIWLCRKFLVFSVALRNPISDRRIYQLSPLDLAAV